MRAFTLALVVSLSFLLVGSAAQPDEGSITGAVKDKTGAALPGVTVRAVTRGRTPATRITDANGEFSFVRMPVGDYDITATLQGFAPFTTRVLVRKAETTRIS